MNNMKWKLNRPRTTTTQCLPSNHGTRWWPFKGRKFDAGRQGCYWYTYDTQNNTSFYSYLSSVRCMIQNGSKKWQNQCRNYTPRWKNERVSFLKTRLTDDIDTSIIFSSVALQLACASSFL
jgi:hypothetical protein